MRVYDIERFVIERKFLAQIKLPGSNFCLQICWQFRAVQLKCCVFEVGRNHFKAVFGEKSAVLSLPGTELQNLAGFWKVFYGVLGEQRRLVDPVGVLVIFLVQVFPGVFAHVSTFLIFGGESGIRTHGTVARTHAFQACTFNHSVISPRTS